VADDRVISVVDPAARHVHKTVHQRQDGYKAHVAIEPDTGLFTAAELTQASGSDNHEAVVGLALLDDDEPAAVQVLGDAAYGTGEARVALQQAGHIAVIKPAPLRPAVPGGFTIDDFTVDEQAGTMRCPNGLTRPITVRRTVTFGAACRGCRCRCAAPPRRPAAPSICTNTTRCCARPAVTGPPAPACATSTGSTPMVERSITWLIVSQSRLGSTAGRPRRAWSSRRVAREPRHSPRPVLAVAPEPIPGGAAPVGGAGRRAPRRRSARTAVPMTAIQRVWSSRSLHTGAGQHHAARDVVDGYRHCCSVQFCSRRCELHLDLPRLAAGQSAGKVGHSKRWTVDDEGGVRNGHQAPPLIDQCHDSAFRRVQMHLTELRGRVDAKAVLIRRGGTRAQDDLDYALQEPPEHILLIANDEGDHEESGAADRRDVNAAFIGRANGAQEQHNDERREIYVDGVAQVWAYPNLWMAGEDHFHDMDRLMHDITEGTLPAYAFIEPNHGFGPGEGNSQHPGNNTISGDSFVAGEALMARIYNALVANPELFATTLFLITYDEHGGFFDHVQPKRVTAPDGIDDRATGFDFSLTGVRVPAVAICPLIPAGTVDPTFYDHSAIPAAVRQQFAPETKPLTRRDAASADLLDHLPLLPASRTDLRPVRPSAIRAGTPEAMTERRMNDFQGTSSPEQRDPLD
jgi:hypothetical protein